MDARQDWPRLVGGRTALDFANTDVVTNDDGADDVLRSAADFLAWCAYAGLASAQATLSPAHERALLRDAAALRSAVRSVMEAVAAQRPVDADALAALQSAWADAVA